MMGITRYEKILIATTNRGKAVEIEQLLTGAAGSFVWLGDLPAVEKPSEDGGSFAENAAIKARHYARSHGLPSVADDSGLMVEALDGAPGIHSARLVGPGGSDDERNAKLIELMSAISDYNERTARFVCSACFHDPDNWVEIIEEGTLDGHIAFEPDGGRGFGFDPIFIPSGHKSTLAALGPNVKNSISHRRKAFERLAKRLREL